MAESKTSDGNQHESVTGNEQVDEQKDTINVNRRQFIASAAVAGVAAGIGALGLMPRDAVASPTAAGDFVTGYGAAESYLNQNLTMPVSELPILIEPLRSIEKHSVLK